MDKDMSNDELAHVLRTALPEYESAINLNSRGRTPFMCLILRRHAWLGHVSHRQAESACERINRRIEGKYTVFSYLADNRDGYTREELGRAALKFWHNWLDELDGPVREE